MADVLEFIQRRRSWRLLALAPLLAMARGGHASIGTQPPTDGGDARATDGTGGFNGFGGYPSGAGGFPGGVDAGAGGSGGALGCVVALDCAGLPHVRAGVDVPCVNGRCVLPSGSCEHGFDHCTLSPRSGCETDLSTPDNCGQCNFRCFEPEGICTPANGTFFCGETCGGPDLPTSCGLYCTNLDNDPANCSACGKECFLPNTLVQCDRGTCLDDGCIDSSWADCTDAPGCETALGTATDCGLCGDAPCTIANTLFSCSDRLGCAAGVWASPITGPTITSIAVTADGGVLAAGSDVLGAAFVTRFTAGGDSVWSFDFGGQATVGTSVSASGTTFVVGGTNSGSEDFDPGSAIDPIFGDVSFVARYTF